MAVPGFNPGTARTVGTVPPEPASVTRLLGVANTGTLMRRMKIPG